MAIFQPRPSDWEPLSQSGWRAFFLSCSLLLVTGTTVLRAGDDPATAFDTAAQYSASAVAPVFGQLLAYTVPQGFSPAYEHTQNSHYVQEWVRQGETLDAWTEMVSLTGEKEPDRELAEAPESFLKRVYLTGFHRNCPASFAAAPIGATRFSGFDAFVAVLSCGMTASTPPSAGSSHSESALIIVIKGERSYYTVQWAQRGPASHSPLELNAAMWGMRYKTLQPIRLCPIVPGETAPYPSCLRTP